MEKDSAFVDEESQNQDKLESDPPSSLSLSRRAFFGSVTGLAAAAWAVNAIVLEPLAGTKWVEVEAKDIGPLNGVQRADRAFNIRVAAAQLERNVPIPDHPSNGDEDLLPNKIGNYSKGLPHNNLGEVDPDAYGALIFALSTGRPRDFKRIPLGCPDPKRQRRLVNPQAALAFDLEGTDSHQLAISAAPAFSSAEQAANAGELYWMALARDVRFTDYETNSMTQAAAADLSRFSGFRGPKKGGRVTPNTLFRGFTTGDLEGPYVSQFLLKTVVFGAEQIVQQIRTLLPGIDYMTQFSDWLEIQNGCRPSQSDQFDQNRRFIRNGRDLAQYTHVDVLFQAYFNACLILLMGAPFNPDNPYNLSRTEDGFGTFGVPHITTLLAEVATRALKAVWYQKWAVHRQLRPEAFGGRVHNRVTGSTNYPIHPDLLNSQALQETFNKYSTFLLPQTYPEGSPLHPSYGAGHATVAGASVTVLKAFFDESFLMPDPVVPSPDGLSLVPFSGTTKLTVGGELNKLAANISMGRNFAGIHYRADYTESVKLGEAIAISILRDQRSTFNEDFAGFTFTKFDGTKITV